MNKLILALSILFVAATSSAALVPMDGQETHGGNIVLSEFWRHHNYITSTLAQCPRAQANALASTWLNKTQKTEVKTAARVFIGENFDQEVVASSSPKANPPTILVSETLWPKLNEIEKTKIVMHEVLPVLGYIDSAYDYSAQLYAVFFDCLIPKVTDAGLVKSFIQCDERFIENWGPAEMSVFREGAMSSALFYNCMPAVWKLLQYGHPIGACDTSDISARHDSNLSSAIIGYYPGSSRSEAVLDFILSLKNSDLTADCDPQFVKACRQIATRSAGLDDKPPKLVALSNKLSCPK